MQFCDSDVDCNGMYDNCGQGTEFTICTTDTTDVPSGCNDIRYTKGKLNSSTNNEKPNEACFGFK